MIGEFYTASNLLGVALERYINACSAIENYSIPRELLGRLSNEISLAATYATKIGHAKVVLSRARNHSALAPINTLPTEILIRVFELVLDAQECGFEEIAREERTQDIIHNGTHMHPLKLPDLLSSVCFRWRRIMTTRPNFWTHIDLVTNCSLSKLLLAHAKTYVTRAGRFPLDLHVVDADPYGTRRKGVRTEDPLFQFLATAGRQMKSLHLVMLGEVEWFHSWILGSCFERATPGTLTRLCVSGQTSIDRASGTFLEPEELSRGPKSLLLRLSKRVLEDLWHPVTVLRLTGLYPYWDSRAYHGLVELRLTQWNNERPVMTISQLTGILTSSPNLRILELEFGITEPFPVDAPIDPVQLNDLEILIVLAMSDSELKAFLPLIAPGSKPLQLSLTLPAQSLEDSSKREIYEFLGRSNVAKLYAVGSDVCLWLGELLDESPQTRALAVRWDTYTEIYGPSSYSGDGELLDLRPRLDDLYIHDSRVDLEGLQRLAERCPVHTLTVQCCEVSRNGATMTDMQELKNSLAHSFPIVRLLTRNEKDPTDDWELFQ